MQSMKGHTSLFRQRSENSFLLKRKRRTEKIRVHAAILIVRTRVYPTFLLISKALGNEVVRGDERFYTRQQVEFDPRVCAR